MNYTCFVAVLLGCLTACGRKEDKAPVAAIPRDDSRVILTDAQLQNTPVETMQLSMQQMATLLKLNGKIDVPPQNMISVSTPLGGYLKSTRLLPGMRVAKGEVIAIIENPQFVQLQQDYLTAKSKLHFAALDYNRQKELNQSQASSDKIMQQAQSEMNSQQILMNAIAQQLQLVNIAPATVTPDHIRKSAPVYSSINGYVSKVNVNIGKYVNPSDILFELINPDDIHLNLKVYEKDLAMLKPGLQLIAYTNTDPGKKYTGTIHLISRDVDASGLADIHCHFERYDPGLIPGTYMNAEIQVETALANVLPEESVVDFEGKTYVFVEEKRKNYRLAPVITGTTEKGFVQVQNYKEFSGKNIVTKNAYTLLMKLKNTGDENE
ncbi:efflux RND transporter periplasmic adaptor subunit [Niabella drilacis]|uniref:Membrane fusion protein, cobalt-zinc-cadmium efflux system n=1 Tax=Niabella drilacis (strain DSM 25811 / CCM 8410 / CCUG 62505 / LMG 26954 / E90) TaxID=1285928 RepID=A0A1G6RBZ2_NIADE|nr:efflux RND transporter periplasmic adaptor subunit [Niabella drilacis]SDD01426.1 membrane fusion protein, cobalt-zinc-cadmium efflux system [Niabella drilacis]